MTLLTTISSPINDIADSLGPNDLPYAIPVHPNLVHLTIGLFAIGIAFDFAGAFTRWKSGCSAFSLCR